MSGDVGAVERAGLENRCGESHRGFESPSPGHFISSLILNIYSLFIFNDSSIFVTIGATLSKLNYKNILKVIH
jgi:hypothetical protein